MNSAGDRPKTRAKTHLGGEEEEEEEEEEEGEEEELSPQRNLT